MTTEFKIRTNATDRQYDLKGRHIRFTWRCVDCDAWGDTSGLIWDTSAEAATAKTNHRKGTGHKRVRVTTARQNVYSRSSYADSLTIVSVHTLATLPVGTKVRVPNRKNAVGTVISHHMNRATNQEVVLIKFEGKGGTAFNFPGQCAIV